MAGLFSIERSCETSGVRSEAVMLMFDPARKVGTFDRKVD